MKKHLRTACLLITLCLVLSGCSLTDNSEPAATPPPVPTVAPVEPVENAPVALVNGNEILRSDFVQLFNYYYQQLYYYLDFSDVSTLNMLQDNILSNLIQREVVTQQAVQQGFVLSADEQSQLETNYQSQYESLMSSYRASAENMDEEDVEGYAKKLLGIDLEAAGYGTVDEYLAKMKEQLKAAMLVTKLQNSVHEGITLTEEEASAQYGEDLAAQTESYTATPANFESAQSSYESGSGAMPLYVPEGFRRVKHILIKTAEGVDAEAKATEVYGKAIADPDKFDALMAEYGEDPGMKAEPNKTLGYLCSETTSFVPEFLEAALSLKKVGDITKPVQSDHGYHIITLAEIMESGPRSFEEVKESYMGALLSTRQSEAFQALVDQWVAEANIDNRIDVVRDVGVTQE